MSKIGNYIVKNINGTSDRKPEKTKTWLEYWEIHAGKKAAMCHCCRREENLIGAHVKLTYCNEWYIVPLCKFCNKRTDDFTAAGELVPVNLKTNYIRK